MIIPKKLKIVLLMFSIVSLFRREVNGQQKLFLRGTDTTDSRLCLSIYAS